MADDDLDVSDEEWQTRRDEADLISRLILAGVSATPLTQSDIDRVLGL